MRFTVHLFNLLFAWSVAFVASPVRAQDAVAKYPERPVTIVVPYGPGGFPDTMARVVGQRLSEIFGQGFVVDNRPSAGGIVAGETVLKAGADGYTLLLGTGSFWGLLPIQFNANLTFDPVKDFAPVSLLGKADGLLLVNTTKIPVKNLSELVSFLKKHPGEYDYGSPSFLYELAMEVFARQAGVQITHVPYKGSSQLVSGLISGEVGMAVQNISTSKALTERKEKDIEIFAVASAQRSVFAPDIPTFTETGIPYVEFEGSGGILAPAGTPPGIVEKLATALKQIVQNPGVIEKFKGLGFNPVGTTPQEFQGIIRKDVEMLARAIAETGLKPY